MNNASVFDGHLRRQWPVEPLQQEKFPIASCVGQYLARCYRAPPTKNKVNRLPNYEDCLVALEKYTAGILNCDGY